MAISRAFLGSNVTSDATPIDTLGATFDSTGYTNFVVYTKHEGAPTTITVTDNKGSGTYNQLTKRNHGGGNLSGQFHWVKIGTPGTSTTVTMTLGATRPYLRILVWGVTSGLGSMSLVTPERTTEDTGGTVISMLDISPSAASVSFMATGELSSVTYTPGSGWTEDFDNGPHGQSRADGSATTVTPTAIASSALDYVASAASFVESRPFPTTSILDSFNRADEGPPPSASWDYPIATFVPNGLSVISNTVGRTPSNYGGAYWSASTFGPDSEIYGTITTMVGSDTIDFGLLLRIQSPGSGGSGGAGMDGYYVEFRRNSPNYQLMIHRIDNAVFTQIGTTQTPGNLVVGDKIGAQIIGNSIQAYRNPGTGWALYGTPETDSTYSGAGYVGVVIADPTGRLDDVGGGTVVVGGGGITFPSRWATA